ncbi:MAG: HNH endonuclease [Gemmataceae bacterium]|nr:HNH endonuclease [Gemmataceae bacterium]
MNAVPDSLRSAVIHRAGGRCEYCLLSQTGQEATFHVDHIDPISASGASESSNLALACAYRVPCGKGPVELSWTRFRANRFRYFIHEVMIGTNTSSGMRNESSVERPRVGQP